MIVFESVPAQATFVSVVAAALATVAVAVLVVVPTVASLAFERAQEKLEARERSQQIQRWLVVVAGSVAAFGVSIGGAFIAYFFPSGLGRLSGAVIVDIAATLAALGLIALMFGALVVARELSSLALGPARRL